MTLVPCALRGKRVVVTRAAQQARDLAERFEALGAEVILLPAVSFADPQDPAPLDQALRDLARFDWLLFTSQNAVSFFAKRARTLGLVCGELQSPRPMVAAVGPATAKAAREEGLRVDHVAARHSGQALARELWGAITGRRVLLPRSDRAGGDLPRALCDAGANVVQVVAYHTGSGESAGEGALAAIRTGQVDVLTFASPSAFHHLADQIGISLLERLAGRVVLAAIGPTTASAIREAGLQVGIEAAEATSAGLAAAVAEYFQSMKSEGVKPQ